MRTGLFIPQLSEEEALYPVYYIAAYKSRFPAEVDEDGQEGRLPLWVSSKKPHAPVKSVTLASWLRRAMQKGGIDTDKFKAHSLRAAAPAHFRKNKSLSLKQILTRGGWKISAEGSSSVFIKFYQRSASP